jgi:glycosyltransferase involved in cell wall biosynthesis
MGTEQEPGLVTRRRSIVFVAHDTGGRGGMERVSEELIRRLLSAGDSVTVVGRTCSLHAHPGLRFIRVPAPSRPFAIAYPMFFVLASPVVARLRRHAIVHTTGAVVFNRADVSTVHYCHRAATRRVSGSRASRSALAYRLNARIARSLSLAAEAWCYRPRTTRLLCAVSNGLASELRQEFPAMVRAVRTVQNGVDVDVFRPDPPARAAVRAELGIDDRVSVALFVGGDWERKGLASAVDALALAPGWALLVAGPGDPSPLRARALRAGTAARLRFLGPVADTSRVFAAADAFVLPTSYETFSLVTFEAAASGLPLLVTRVSGVDELLRHGENGWFITPTARDIAARLTSLREDPELSASMARAARAAASRYPWSAMAAGYVAVYEELAGEARSVIARSVADSVESGGG